ncbi:MAG TPA: hypothetical protein VG028_07160 [Terriglobia bacterium]|nr:hypothetical protein [Terriglobia bacterium]
MKRSMLVLIVVLATAAFAAAQVTDPSNGDVLGAHNVYGRGCIACHAPHSGAGGNGANQDQFSGNIALWGQDLSPLYNQTLNFGDTGKFTITLPNYATVAPTTAHDPYFTVIACLSCHDGNLAKTAMMKGTSFEQVTIGGLTFNPKTLLGNDGTTAGNYNNDHPIGPTANPGCGGPYNWDCVVGTDSKGNSTMLFTGTASAQFLIDYLDVTSAEAPIANLVGVPGTGTPGPYGTSINSWVTCTTCHDQHSMTDFRVGSTHYQTRFFVRGWYNPGNSTSSNSAAQFCRTCHGGESNEMHGRTIPTT